MLNIQMGSKSLPEIVMQRKLTGMMERRDAILAWMVSKDLTGDI